MLWMARKEYRMKSREKRMRPRGNLHLHVLAAVLAIACSGPEEPRTVPYLVTTAWLASALPDQAVVLHVGGNDTRYRTSHVPGARFISIRSVAAPRRGVPNMLPELRAMATTFGRLGVGDDRPIVIYGDDPGVLAARVWLALDVLGHGHRAALLDGGLEKWQAEGRPVAHGVGTWEAARFTMRPRPDAVADADWVVDRLTDPNTVLVDARPPAQYTGEQPGRDIARDRVGHIRGAHSLYWMGTLDSLPPHVMLAEEAVRERFWTPVTGGRPVTVITYCRTGMQASYAYFQARMLGFEDVRLYDASFYEWSRLSANAHPVARGP